MWEECYYSFMVNMSNLSRRAFLSSLGIAAAAPSVVAKAIEEAGLNSPIKYCKGVIDIDLETYSLDGYFGGDYHSIYVILTDENGKVKSIKLEPDDNSDNDKSSPYFNSDYNTLQLQSIPSRSIL